MKYKIDRDWEFRLSGAAGWRALDLPHDWAIEGDFSPEHYMPAVREETYCNASRSMIFSETSTGMRTI